MTDSMADESLTRKTARELAAMIKARAVSPVEVLDAHLAVIARVNPKLPLLRNQLILSDNC